MLLSMKFEYFQIALDYYNCSQYHRDQIIQCQHKK